MIAGGLPAIPSPTIGATTGDSPGCPAFRLAASRPRYRLGQSLEGSPVHADRIEFTAAARQGPPVLRTGRSRSGALHPASRRRSSGSIPHGSSPHGSGLAPLRLPAFSGARARATGPFRPATRRTEREGPFEPRRHSYHNSACHHSGRRVADRCGRVARAPHTKSSQGI